MTYFTYILYAAFAFLSGTFGPMVEGTSYLSGPGVWNFLTGGYRYDIEYMGGRFSFILGTVSGL